MASNTRQKQLLDLRSLDTASTSAPPPVVPVASATPSPFMGEAIGLVGGYLTRELWSQFMNTFGGRYVEFENLVMLRDAEVITDEEFVSLVVLLPSELTALN